VPSSSFSLNNRWFIGGNSRTMTVAFWTAKRKASHE
jgi:hypothetical protein